MKNLIIENYLNQVVSNVPKDIHEEVRIEVDSIIHEMLMEKYPNIKPSEEQIKETLKQLGSPTELALQYSGLENKSLISGIYFLVYMRTLKIILPIIAIISFVGSLFSLIFSRGEGQVISIFGIINFTAQAGGNLIGSVISSVISAFAIITIIFAILQYKKVDISEWSVGINQIPDFENYVRSKKTEGGIDEFEEDDEVINEEPKNKTIVKHKIPIGESIWEIIVGIFILILLLIAPQVVSARIDGEWIPIFDIEIIRSLWIPILLSTGFMIGSACYNIGSRYYSFKVLAVNFISGLVILACIIYIFAFNDVVNPIISTYINDVILADVNINATIPFINNVVENAIAHIFIVGAIITLIIDLSYMAYKTFEAERIKFGL